MHVWEMHGNQALHIAKPSPGRIIENCHLVKAGYARLENDPKVELRVPE